MTSRDEVHRWEPKRVLVGYDGSSGANDAVALAGLLTPGERAEVVLANVLPSPSSLPGTIRLLRHDEWPDADGFFKDAVAALPGRTVDGRTYFGSPARVLDDLAETGEFDLLCVGAPHLGRLGRTLGGSVGEALLHGAPVPIASASPGLAERSPALRRIAVAYDGSPESAAALRRAEALALASGARLLILTVDSDHDPISSVYSYTLDLPDGKALLLRAVRGVDDRIEADGRLLNGEVDRALAGACGGSDLLLVGSRGYGPLARVLLGSVSSRLISECQCPVLIEPRPRPRPGSATSPAATPEREVLESR